MADYVRIDSTTTREAADFRRALTHLDEANQLVERLLAWSNNARSGDIPGGNTEIETVMGAEVGEGGTIYTAISTIATALDGLEDELATITW
jgi:hypothetical protein